jgi:predicted AlkP superfamily pyrophosphatase or phosphodiesterase
VGLGEHLSAAGIVDRGGPWRITSRRSSFTKMLYKGVTTLEGHYLGSDLWVRLRELMAETRGRPAFLTAYWSGLDTLGHAYGPDTDLWLAEFSSVSELHPSRAGRTLAGRGP